MKPINEKERTNAFIQFMLLLTVLLILAMVLVLPNGEVVSKEGALLNKKSSELKEFQNFTSNMASEIGSLNTTVMGFDKLTQADYEIKSRKFVDELRSKWKPSISDTTNIDRIRVEMFNVISQWAYDKGSTIRELDKVAKIKTLYEEMKQKDADYKELNERYEKYKTEHP